MYNLNGDTSKINGCVIKEKAKNHPNWIRTIGKLLDKAESALSARLPREKFSGIVDLMKLVNADASEAEIERALVSFANEMKIFCQTNQAHQTHPTIQTQILYFCRHIYMELM